MSQKRKCLSPTNEMQCCICFENHQPSLMYIGCSSKHTVCHFCSRSEFSSKLTMCSFPLHNPYRVSDQNKMRCPICREALHGLTNIFVLNGEPREENLIHFCPYKDVETNPKNGCQKEMSFLEIQRHLLQHHSNTIKCQNCNVWLQSSDQRKSFAKLMEKHIKYDCPSIECKNCARTGTYLALLSHSRLGDSYGVCDGSLKLWRQFVMQLMATIEEKDESESFSAVAFLQLDIYLKQLYGLSIEQIMVPQITPKIVLHVALYKLYEIYKVSFEMEEKSSFSQFRILVETHADWGKFMYQLVSNINSPTNLSKMKFLQRLVLSIFTSRTEIEKFHLSLFSDLNDNENKVFQELIELIDAQEMNEMIVQFS